MSTREMTFQDETFYWRRSGKRATVLETNCVLAQRLDSDALQNALASALKVHTNFRSRPQLINHRFAESIDDVQNPPLFKENGRPKHLGTSEMEGLLLYVSYGENDFTLHVFHSIADLRSIHAFLHTLLAFYVHETGLAQPELPEPDSVDTFACYEMILGEPAPEEASSSSNQEEREVFHLPEKLFSKRTTKQRMFQIDVPLEPLLAFSKAHKSSVVPALHAVIGHAVRECYDVGQKDVVCYVPMDLRPVFHFESGGNATANFTLTYSPEIDRSEVGERARLLRSEMNERIKLPSIYARVAAMRETLEPVFASRLPVGLLSRIAVNKGRETDAANYTYGISYVGKVRFDEAIDPYVASVASSAGSYSYPLWIFPSEYKGTIRMRLVQSFESDKLAKRIYEELLALIPGARFEDQGHHEFDSFLLRDVSHSCELEI